MDTHDKEKILARMDHSLRSDQLKQLRHVLETLDMESSVSNDTLLQRFIDAKKVEGCSSSTIEYYRSTLQRMQGLCSVAFDGQRALHGRTKRKRQTSSPVLHRM